VTWSNGWLAANGYRPRDGCGSCPTAGLGSLAVQFQPTLAAATGAPAISAGPVIPVTAYVTGLTAMDGNGTVTAISTATNTSAAVIDIGGFPIAIAITPSVAAPPAGPIVSGYRKNKCVDDRGDAVRNGTPVVIWDCNGNPDQNWVVEPTARSAATASAWTSTATGKEQRPGRAVHLHVRRKQQWKAVTGTLVNPVSRKRLDDPRFNTANGTQLVIYTCNGGRNQQWTLP
jgi:hypothetical protein